MQFNMTIDPRVGQWLNLVAFALSTLAMASWWQDMLTVKQAALTVGIMNWAVSVLNFVLHGMPAPGDTVKRAFMLLLALFALVLFAHAAQAQPKRPVVVAASSTVVAAAPQKPVFCDPLNFIPGCKQAPATSLKDSSPEEIAAKIQKLFLGDFIYARALAQSTNNTVTFGCWDAWVTLLQQQQQPLIGPQITEPVTWSGNGAPFMTQAPHNLMVGQQVTLQSPPAGLTAGTTYYVIQEGYTATTFELSASPEGMAIIPTGPATGASLLTAAGHVLQRPDPGLVTSVEYVSEAVQLLQSNSPIAVKCAPMAQALQKDITTLLSNILSGGALGLFKLPIPIGLIP